MNTGYIGNPQKDYEKLLMLHGIIDEFQEKRPTTKIDNYKEITYQIIRDFVREIKVVDFDFGNLQLGHDFGHVLHDLKSALLLLDDPKLRERVSDPDIIAGCIGQFAHELGLLLAYYTEFCSKEFGFVAVYRYDESEQLLRHAEAGGLLALYILGKMDFAKFGIDPQTENYIKKIAAYSISAHTNSKEAIVSGYTYKLYRTAWNDGSSIWPVYLTRWADRMDCVGPHYILRHFSILYEEGKSKRHTTSVDGKQTESSISIEKSMDLSSDENMMGHVMMFFESQNNGTIYGKNDLKGVIIKYRQHQKIKHIIAIAALYYEDQPTLTREELLSLVKSASLCAREDQINALIENFFQLEDNITTPWLRTFYKIRQLLNDLTIPSVFPGEKQAMEQAKKLLGV
jgi:hypothetical protein